MNRITISQEEYRKLRKQASAYKKLASRLFEAVIKDPIKVVVADFRKSGIYTQDFLHDLEAGLRKSSYGR